VPRLFHPLHAVLLAGTVPLFLGALLGDIAYAGSYEVQWKNFASWLIVGGLFFGGIALIWGIVELLRGRRETRVMLYVLVLLVAWILGLIDALVHAADAWASMPQGLILSAIVAALAMLATGVRFARPHEPVRPRARQPI
jgi:uncharacterized membrane protein